MTTVKRVKCTQKSLGSERVTQASKHTRDSRLNGHYTENPFRDINGILWREERKRET